MYRYRMHWWENFVFFLLYMMKSVLLSTSIEAAVKEADHVLHVRGIHYSSARYAYVSDTSKQFSR